MTAANHILVVEDEAVIRSSLRRLLERHEYKVSEAGSVQEALDNFDINSFDVVRPSNLNAIKHGLLGTVAEDNADLERANYHWNVCKQLLEEELDAYRGSAKPTVNFDPTGSGSRIPNVM